MKKFKPNDSPATDDVAAGIKLTHPDKIFYPETKTTKRNVAEYYELAAQWMLPHVVDRPLALVRCPQGQASKCFFQRNWSSTLPKAVNQVDVSDGTKKEIHVGVHDLSGVVSLVQIGVLEIHTWNCRSKNIERPDQLIFDLDPGPDVKWDRVIEAAQMCAEALTKLDLPVYLKTSGGKGLHLTIPIKADIGGRRPSPSARRSPRIWFGNPTCLWRTCGRICAGESLHRLSSQRPRRYRGRSILHAHRTARQYPCRSHGKSSGN